MINAILTIMALAVSSFAAAFVVGAGAHTWAFRSRHYPQESRRGLCRNPDLPWIVGSLVAGLVILTLACLPAFAQEVPRPKPVCTDLLGELNRASVAAQKLRGLARVEIVKGNEDREHALLDAASTLGALAAQVVVTSPCFNGAAQ